MGTIAEEITRLQAAKSNIRTAIQNKGVVVDETTTIDGYATLINQITTGEGGGKWALPTGIRFTNSTLSNFDVSGIDTTNTTSFQYLFSSCQKLQTITGIENWIVSNVRSLEYMFYNCSALTLLDLTNWTVSNVVYLSHMFDGCSLLTSIDLSSWKLLEKPFLSYIFHNCTSLTSANLNDLCVNGLWSTKNMFYGCTNLSTVSIKNWDFQDNSNTGDEFYGCSSLTTLDMTGCLLYEVSKMSFSSCTNLENLSFGADATQNWSFDSNEKLTVDSLMSIINGLYDFISNGKTPSSSQGKLTLGSTNLAKLSDEQKAIATNKGWTLL